MLEGSSTSPLLMMIEAEEDYAVLFQRIFSKVARHWRIIQVNDVPEAIRHIVHEECPDLLVMNFNTPHLKAKDMVEWIQFIKTPKNVSVLIFDHVLSPIQEQELSDLGIREYLNKRSPVEKYRAVLQRVVDAVEINRTPISAPAKGKPVVPGFSRRF